jgi:hypothetical protein
VISHRRQNWLIAEKGWVENGVGYVKKNFFCDYITNLLEARSRALSEASPLHLTRRQDLLDLEVDQPDLSLYEATHENKNSQ